MLLQCFCFSFSCLEGHALNTFWASGHYGIIRMQSKSFMLYFLKDFKIVRVKKDNKNYYRELFRPPHEQIYSIIRTHVGWEEYIVKCTKVLSKNRTFTVHLLITQLHQFTVYCLVFCNRKILWLKFHTLLLQRENCFLGCRKTYSISKILSMIKCLHYFFFKGSSQLDHRSKLANKSQFLISLGYTKQLNIGATGWLQWIQLVYNI